MEEGKQYQFDANLDPIGYMNGVDCQGHPVYNNFDLFGDNEMYNNIHGIKENFYPLSRLRNSRYRLGLDVMHGLGF
jgi:hypothetical protein